METSGISIISAKTLPSETAAVAYNNPAFDDDNGNTDAKNGITTATTAPSNTSTTTTTNNNSSNNNNNSNNVPRMSSSDKGPRLYDDISHSKRGSSSVDFTMPEKKPRDRLKSLTTADGPYRGMGKEELLRYSSKPLWRNLRYVCMSIVLTGWLALLITVVALVLTYPQCREAQDREWWQKAVIYRVYVRSFLDAEGSDGIGDINGIRAKLDYIESTGANTISLSPFYRLSSNAPTDTHIVDHKAVQPGLGTLEQFGLLVNETHARGMHITVDFIPNHTSDQHPWFISSQANPDGRHNEFRSYYVWAEGAGPLKDTPINNWKSIYGCSAWSPDGTNNSMQNVTDIPEFYLHQHLDTQPDLNLRSDKVKEELEDILLFWLELGVDGFYVRDSDFLFEDYDLRDETLLSNDSDIVTCGSQPEYAYSAYEHEYTRGQSQNFDMLARWRAFLDDYGNRTNSYRILFADAVGSVEHIMDYYGLFNRDGVDFPLNTQSISFNSSRGGRGIGHVVTSWMENMEEGRWPNWMGGDDRSPRLTQRLGEQLSKTYLLLMMLLPGTPFMYYGDEIGMHSAPVPASLHEYERAKPMRSPMLWNNKSFHHGFCHQHCQATWMNQSRAVAEVKDDQGNVQFIRLDAEAQKGRPDSIWNLFKNLTDLRKDNPSFVYGDYAPALQDEHVFSFVREFDGEKGYLVAVNFDSGATRKYFKGSHSTVPGGGTVELVSGKDSGHSKGGSVGLDPLHLAAFEGIVVSWDYEAKEL